MERAVTINNGEKITGASVTVYDQKGQPMPVLPEGWTVFYGNDNPAVAQIVQENEQDLIVDITTEGDAVGVARLQADVKDPAGNALLDSDGTPTVLVVTVVNTPPNTASFTVGTVVPE